VRDDSISGAAGSTLADASPTAGWSAGSVIVPDMKSLGSSCVNFPILFLPEPASGCNGAPDYLPYLTSMPVIYQLLC
jgi:hypothetical protein